MDIDKEQVKKAASALQLIIKNKKSDDLLDSPVKIWLQFGFQKIPQLKEKKIKLHLPHGLATPNQTVSLFVKDLDKKARDYTDTVFHYKELLSKHGIEEISEIIPLKALKTMYKPFEAKRNLSNSFDLHLADDRIVRLLPPQLGKNFYGRNKHPVQVKLTAKDLKTEIQRAVNNSRCLISGRGGLSSAYVAHSKQTVDDITDNIIYAAQRIAQNIPGGAANVKFFSVRTEKSVSLPIYVSLGSANDIKLPKVETKVEEIEAEDVTTVMGGKVRVFPSGDIEIVTEESERKRKLKLEKAEMRTNQQKEPRVKKRRTHGPKVATSSSKKGIKSTLKLPVVKGSRKTLKSPKLIKKTKKRR